MATDFGYQFIPKALRGFSTKEDTPPMYRMARVILASHDWIGLIDKLHIILLDGDTSDSGVDGCKVDHYIDNSKTSCQLGILHSCRPVLRIPNSVTKNASAASYSADIADACMYRGPIWKVAHDFMDKMREGEFGDQQIDS